MIPVYWTLVGCYICLVGCAMFSGLISQDERSFAMHFAFGLSTTLYCCFMYCVCLTYFVITGKLVKQAVLKGHLDERLIRQTQSKKGSFTRLLALAVLVLLTAAILGALAGTGGNTQNVMTTLHLVAQIIATIINLICLFRAYDLIIQNRSILDNVFERYNSHQSELGNKEI